MTSITLENKEEPTRYSNMKTIVIDNDDAEDQNLTKEELEEENLFIEESVSLSDDEMEEFKAKYVEDSDRIEANIPFLVMDFNNEKTVCK